MRRSWSSAAEPGRLRGDDRGDRAERGAVEFVEAPPVARDLRFDRLDPEPPRAERQVGAPPLEADRGRAMLPLAEAVEAELLLAEEAEQPLPGEPPGAALVGEPVLAGIGAERPLEPARRARRASAAGCRAGRRPWAARGPRRAGRAARTPSAGARRRAGVRRAPRRRRSVRSAPAPPSPPRRSASARAGRRRGRSASCRSRGRPRRSPGCPIRPWRGPRSRR